MVEHTPGPWSIEKYGDEDCPALVIHKDTESRICFMATPGSRGDPAQIEADAHLIAAAPDLLEALNDLLNDCINFDGGRLTEVFQEKAARAIAKATPRS